MSSVKESSIALRRMDYSEFDILKLNEFGLRYEQVCILKRNALVDDTIVEGLYRLLRFEHPGTVGFESTVLRFYNSMRRGTCFKNRGIAHIYHNGSNHFVSAVQTCSEFIEFADSI